MWRSNKRVFDNSGFLLLEVLVSIVMISVGLVYVVRSFSSSTRAMETTGHFLKSVSLIEEKLWDLEAKGAIEKGEESGRFEEDEIYRWEIESEGLKDFPINVLKLKVLWKGLRESSQRISIETYLYNEEE